MNCFSYAVYDFLENYVGFEKYSFLYGQDLNKKLREVLSEWQLVDKHENGHRTKEFLQECLKGRYDYFIKDKLRPFLMTFLYDSVKESLGKRDCITYVSEDF